MINKTNITYQEANGFDDDPMTDTNLFQTISESMRAHMDIEEVSMDPDLAATRAAVSGMMTDYNKYTNEKNRNFICETLSESSPENAIDDELKFIRQDIRDNKLNEVTAEWVKEWHERKQRIGSVIPASDEIKNFVLNATDAPHEISEPSTEKATKPAKTIFVKWTALAAAAMLGAFILIRTLLPSSDPDKLFKSYYSPFEAVSTATRSVNKSIADTYSSSVNSYRTGDYLKASAGFAGMIQMNPSLTEPRFFMGLSELGLGNYNEAINMLSSVSASQGDYGKEARWYLGLAYLKVSDKQKAAGCFEYLAGKEGFYKERAEKILRRLK
jgi:TolA-binding protein